MITFKLSLEAYLACTSLIGQLWGFQELRNNPRTYVMTDARWHIIQNRYWRTQPSPL